MVVRCRASYSGYVQGAVRNVSADEAKPAGCSERYTYLNMPSETDENGGLWLGIVFSAVTLVGALVTALILKDQRNRALEKTSWPTVVAAESAARVDKRTRSSSAPGCSPYYAIEAKYKYRAGDGNIYETDWKFLDSHCSRTPSEQDAGVISSRIREGHPLDRLIRYDPENPSRSSFRISRPSRFVWAIFPLIYGGGASIALVASLVVLVVRKRHRRNPHP